MPDAVIWKCKTISHSILAELKFLHRRVVSHRSLEPVGTWLIPVVGTAEVNHLPRFVPPRLRSGGVNPWSPRTLKQVSCTADPGPGDPIRIALVNARSVANKTFILNNFFVCHKLDFLCLTETWLSVGENASSVEPETDQEMSNKITTRDKKEEEEDHCNVQAIAHHLKLEKNSINYTLSRPVKHNKRRTKVSILVNLYAILDMREKDQTFVSYIWVHLGWENELIRWNPKEFCGIKEIKIPTKYMWMPDIVIEEMTEKDKAAPSPYLSILSNGWVYYKNDQVVISTCKMHVYKFPFDIQSCSLTFKSVLHDDSDISLRTGTRRFMKEFFASEMHTQYEWVYIKMSPKTDIVQRSGVNRTRVIYTIDMKRRSVHYLANFLLPILFFLVLDLASFLISDSGGEKLSFKVTVLLAVTVMQLLLNEILPSSSDSIPLIVIYCIGIFALMLLSVLETILVMHLIDKDSAAQDDETDGERSLAENSRDRPNFHSFFREMKRCNHCASSCEVSADEKTSVCMSSVTQKDSSSKLTEVSSALEKVSDELWETRKTVTLLSSSSRKPGYWTRMVKKINKGWHTYS